MGERAVTLPLGRPWLNCSRPLSLDDLRGHVVAIVIWRGARTAARHTLAIVARLSERLRGRPFVALGVLTAELDAERVTDRVLDTLQRCGVEMPVLLDNEGVTAKSLDLTASPAVLLLGARGTLQKIFSGEPTEESLEAAVEELLAIERDRSALTSDPLDLHSTPARIDSVLAFPSALALSPDGWLAVSDTGHHRVLLIDPDGNIVDIIGSGQRGQSLGGFEETCLDDPQGLCFVGDELVICDASRHVVLLASLRSRTVTVLAGTGMLGLAPLRSTRPAREVSLRSPTSVLAVGDDLVVSLTGSHQLASINRSRGEISPLSGRGEPGSNDGTLDTARFDEPSVLVRRNDSLLVLDGAGSRLRRIHLGRGEVITLPWRGEKFLSNVRQRSQLVWTSIASGPSDDLCLTNGITDTVEHVSPSGSISRFFEFAHGIGLREPSAIVHHPARSSWLIADTGNHRLVMLDETGADASVVALQAPILDRTTSLPPSTSRPSSAQTSHLASEPYPPSSGSLPAQGLGPGQGVLLLSLVLDHPTWRLETDTPIEVLATVLRGGELIAVPDGWMASTITPIEIAVLVYASPTVASLAEISVQLVFTLTHLHDRSTIRSSAAIVLPIVVDPSGVSELHYEIELPVIDENFQA